MIESSVIYENPNGKLFVYPDEVVGTIVGVEVHNHSLSVHKEFTKIFNAFKEVLKEQGISKVYSLCDTDKEQRFNESFGLKFTGSFAECSDGTISRLMVLEVENE